MRAIREGLLLIALLAVACSDRVPAPVTPMPSPRPGYPPSPVTELPEGVLYVQKSTTVPSSLFAMAPGKGPEESVTSSGVLAAAGGSHAVVGSLQGGLILGIGLLTGTRYQKVADGPWAMGSPMFLWSNDGRRLAYTVPENEQPAGKSRVWTLDTQTGEQVRLTPEADVYLLLGWTAAREVLAGTPEGLVLLGASDRSLALPEAGEVVDVEVSPDGRSVAVQLGEYEYRTEDGLTYIHSSGIWIGELASGDWREVMDLSGEPPEVLTTGPSEMHWSADGRRISTHLTQMDDRGVITDHLSVVNVTTGELTRVHEQGWGWESWSPDGRYLAHMYEGNSEPGRTGGRRLGILGPGGRTREVEAHPRGMAWAGNGRLLLDIPGRLSILDPETMEVEEVRTEGGESISVLLEAVVWSPSGRYLSAPTPSDAYHRSSLYVIDTETGTAELFFDEAGFSAVAWVRE